MPKSGIQLTDRAKKTADRVFKKDLGGAGSKIPYAVFKFADDKKWVVVDEDEKFYSKHIRYNDLLALLPPDMPRYVVYDLPHYNPDKTKTSTVIIVSWAPQSSPSTLKFMTGSTFIDMATELRCNEKIEGDEISELSEEAVCDKFAKLTFLPDDQKDPLPDKEVDIRGNLDSEGNVVSQQ